MKKIFKPFLAAVLCIAVAASGLGMASASTLQMQYNSEAVYVQDVLQQAQQSSRLVISEPGVYTLQGNMKGSVWVDPGYGEVTLILDNATIDGGNAAAIIGMSGDRLNILTQDNTVNTLINGVMEQYNNALNALNAAVYSYVNLLLGGTGSLNVQGGSGYGVFSNQGAMTVNGGSYTINSALEGFATGNMNSNPVDFINGNFNVNNNVFRQQTPDSNPIIADQFAQEFGYTAPSQVQDTLYTQPDQTALNNPFSRQTQGNPFSQQPQSYQGGKPEMTGQMTGQMTGGMPGMQNIAGTLDSASSASAIVEGTTYNSAMDLTADYDNATYYDVSETSQVKITSSGTYVVTGTSEDGNITVKKGTTGVVLVLEDLDLTSTTGATLSINKQAEVQVIVSGNVTLTDNENPDDEYSLDADIADAYDGAAIKVKAESMVYITGDGTLNVRGNAKNGIKGGDDSSIVFGGNVVINIDAENDGINSNYDLAFLGGKMRINAGDDGIHADHIVTIGNEDGTGPEINVESSTEGIEGTVVNMRGGKVEVNSSDDAINAANGDGLYEGVLDYAFNMTGGELTIHSQGDGIDSNGNINLIDGSAMINSSSTGGEAGMDYDGQLYVSDGFELYNNSGVAGPDGMAGGMIGMTGNMGGMPNDMFAGNSQFGGNQSQAFGGNQGFGQQQGGFQQTRNMSGIPNGSQF